MPIAWRVVHEFFIEKSRGQFRCPVCANPSFAVNVDGLPGTPQNEFVAELTIPGQTASHVFFTLVCTNCGYTVSFHQNQFDAWQKARGKTI